MNCPTPIERVSNRLLSRNEQRTLFADCKWSSDWQKIVVSTPKGPKALGRKIFNVYFGGFTFMLDENNERLTRSAWEAFKALGWGRTHVVDTDLADRGDPR